MREEGKIDILSSRILAQTELSLIITELKNQGKTIATTNGCFDLLHVGHVRSLQFAKSQADILIVGVNSDESVKKNKGPLRPIVPEHERAELLLALSYVDYVFVFDDETPMEWLEMIKPHVHVKGSDRELSQILEKDLIEQHGGRIVLFDHTGAHSTTDTIARIKRI
jgi:rfaE bifunctional protein nucleotidyltransferase chain/domain